MATSVHPGLLEGPAPDIQAPSLPRPPPTQAAAPASTGPASHPPLPPLPGHPFTPLLLKSIRGLLSTSQGAPQPLSIPHSPQPGFSPAVSRAAVCFPLSIAGCSGLVFTPCRRLWGRQRHGRQARDCLLLEPAVESRGSGRSRHRARSCFSQTPMLTAAPGPSVLPETGWAVTAPVSI